MNMPDNTFIIIKRNPQGQETFRYQGQLVRREAGCLVLEAYFNREDMHVGGMLLARGDRFVETYFTDRWYNIFEIYSRDDDHLRGWYCNVTSPARIDGDTLSYVDLALDLVVFPDGRQVVLDEDEFISLEIPQEMRTQALAALAELQQAFREKTLQ